MCSDACRRLLVVIAVGALLSGCDDMTLYRAKSDYFPLVPGSRWTYDVAGNTAIDSVVGDSAIDGRGCVVVLRDYAPEYWTKQVTEVQQFTKLVVNRGGQDYVLEQRYRLAYALPLVEGATWSDSFQAAVVLQGTDTVLVKDSTLGRVAAIEDVSTPAGTFLQCYRIEIHRRVEAAELSFTADYDEWLAPGVGLVRRVTGTDTMELTAYNPGR
ncbi:hypothetical protein FJY68_11815 [candidate division WOR-3 bacterium]|uniref:DUF3108 domain-containing protein n=1 Tax=candidate division WOR-3 bacterium TaxID=2052148 RepID=A0A937XIV1_UNCW3|nr:hypothetical protein [candidate division WOR-3 bacterium]